MGGRTHLCVSARVHRKPRGWRKVGMLLQRNCLVEMVLRRGGGGGGGGTGEEGTGERRGSTKRNIGKQDSKESGGREEEKQSLLD